VENETLWALCAATSTPCAVTATWTAPVSPFILRLFHLEPLPHEFLRPPDVIDMGRWSQYDEVGYTSQEPRHVLT
jgi:hypothetical protein